MKFLFMHSLLWSADRLGIGISEALEADSGSKVRYIGVRIQAPARKGR